MKNFLNRLLTTLASLVLLFAIGGVIFYAVTARAQTFTLQQKQSFSLFTDGAVISPATAHYQLLAGLGPANTIQAVAVDASGNIALGSGSVIQLFAKTTIVSGQVNCGNPATQFPANTVKNVCWHGLQANGATPVYIGPAGVNASTGDEYLAGGGSCEDLANTNILFCFSTAGTQDVSFYGTN